MFALAGIVSGCGGGDDDSAQKTDSPAQTTETAGAAGPDTKKAAGDAAARTGKKIPKESKAAKARRIKKDREQEQRELAQLEKENREFDESFEETPFEKLTERLPVRRPPLFVEQYITGDDHKVYTAVDEKRFLCKRAPGERKRAVAAFFEAADRLLRSGGVDDLVLVVTPVSTSVERLPALATARQGSITLTARGRGRAPC